MPRFRLVPVEVEALQWKGVFDDEARAFVGGAQVNVVEPDIWVYRRSGCPMSARAGDWLVKSDDGSLDVETDAEFQATYQPITD